MRTESGHGSGELDGDSKVADPRTTPANEDVGADTKGRFRYQACYAAWISVGMLSEIPDVAAVFCEHHDDVLIEFMDGRCEAVQVKSQTDSVAPIRGTDKPMVNALRRFVELERDFGAAMRGYRVVSVAGFHRSGKSASNIERCLEQAGSCSDVRKLPAPLGTLVKKLGVPKGVTPEIAIAALRKVVLDATVPKLGDFEARITRAISALPTYAERRFSDLLDAAEAVIALAERAGVATARSAASDYFAYLRDPAGHANRAAIEAKRLHVPGVRSAIDQALPAAGGLRSVAGTDVTALPDSWSVSHRKLDAGGVPSQLVETLDDLRASAETDILERVARHGLETANADYDHIKVAVAALAADARMIVRGPEVMYGPQMYVKFRQLLREDLAADSNAFRGMSRDQATGVAAILTELCKVWWSEEFDLSAST